MIIPFDRIKNKPVYWPTRHFAENLDHGERDIRATVSECGHPEAFSSPSNWILNPTIAKTAQIYE